MRMVVRPGFAPLPRLVRAKRSKFWLSCEILDHPDRIGRNGEEGAAADEDLTGLRQAAVLSPAGPFLTRDPQSCRDEPRGQRSPGNPRQGLRQIVEFTFDQICRDLGCAPQLQKFRAPVAGAVCENATYTAVCFFCAQAQAEMRVEATCK